MSRKPQPIRDSKYRAIINGLLELLAKCYNRFVDAGSDAAWKLQEIPGKFGIVDETGYVFKFDAFYPMLKTCMDVSPSRNTEENKPAKVYIVFHYASESQCPPDTTDVAGVFFTKEKARACMEKHTKGVLAELKDAGASISYSCGAWYHEYYYKEHEIE